LPGAVSSGRALAVLQTISLASLVISKMLASSDAELRGEVMSVMGTPAFLIAAMSGVNQHQNMYASSLLEPLGGGFPVTSYRDGVDTGGLAFDMQSMMPNAEKNEWFYPILYLWRKELRLGRAGKYRGGNSGQLAIVAYDTDRVTIYLASAHNAIPGFGQFGRMPPRPSHYIMYRNEGGLQRSRVTAHIPGDISELNATAERLPPKAYGIRLGKGDVFVMGWSAAGGYGDPLERDFELIAKRFLPFATTRLTRGGDSRFDCFVFLSSQFSFYIKSLCQLPVCWSSKLQRIDDFATISTRRARLATGAEDSM
jgi:N-methylhydantoinase B